MAVFADKRAGKLTGLWVAQVKHKGQTRKGRFATHAEALEKEQQFKDELVLGVKPAKAPRKPVEASQAPSGVLTLSQARKLAEGRVWRGKSSEAGNLANLRNLEDVMGDCSLDAIDQLWVQRMKDELPAKRKVTDATVNRYLASLSKLLGWALKLGYRSVETLPDMEFYDEDQGEIRWLSEEQEAIAIAALDERFAKLVRIAIRTGMRRSELLNLEPKQVRWTEGKGWVDLWKTKSKTPRSIPLTAQDYEDLAWLVDGRMPTIQLLRSAWTKVRKALGDETVRFHHCRHTTATRMVQKGVNLRVIQKYMGHQTIQTTLLYAHVNDELLEGALDKLVAEVDTSSANVVPLRKRA